jgi:hypothetical protein
LALALVLKRVDGLDDMFGMNENVTVTVTVTVTVLNSLLYSSYSYIDFNFVTSYIFIKRKLK